MKKLVYYEVGKGTLRLPNLDPSVKSYIFDTLGSLLKSVCPQLSIQTPAAQPSSCFPL